MLRNFFKRKTTPQSGPLSSGERELRYSDFAAADLPICCKAVRELVRRGAASIEYRFTKKDDTVMRCEVRVNFCPGCGRKL